MQQRVQYQKTRTRAMLDFVFHPTQRLQRKIRQQMDEQQPGQQRRIGQIHSQTILLMA